VEYLLAKPELNDLEARKCSLSQRMRATLSLIATVPVFKYSVRHCRIGSFWRRGLVR
jgi:hypothetical protein